MNKSNINPKISCWNKPTRDLRVYVCFLFYSCTDKNLIVGFLLCIAATAARGFIFGIAAGLTARRTADAFCTVFLLLYKIYYNCSNDNYYKSKNYIIAYTHKYHLYLAATFSLAAAFKAYSAFNFLSVLIMSATTIPIIQSTAIRPGKNAAPNLPDTISVPIW